MESFFMFEMFYFLSIIFIIIGIVLFITLIDNSNVNNKQSNKKTHLDNSQYKVNVSSNKNILNNKEIDLPMSFVGGKTGENKVRFELYKLPEKDYLILNDCIFRVNEKTTQIDHIVISKYGIFVIETKNYNNCYIIGKEKDDTWTYISGNQKYYPKNPVRQNDIHVKRLVKLLNLNYDVFIPIVCICGKNCKLDIASNKTIEIKYLIKKIKSFNEEILSDYKYIYDKLKYYNIYDNQIKREHVYNIKNNKFHISANQKKCPWCKTGYLIKRESEYGKFYGCSNYPKCEYTKDIK